MKSHLLRLALSMAAGIWSPAGDRRLSVLIFHRVRPRRDPIFPGEPDAAAFADAMAVVAEYFTCLPLDQAVDCLAAGGRLPPRAVAITFDDGYADNCTEAVPILRRFGLTATFFVASGFLDGGCMWNDEAIEVIRAYGGGRLDLSRLGLGERPCGTLAEKAAVIAEVLGVLKYRSPEARREALDCLMELTGVAAVPRQMLSTAQVREMRDAGMGIGGHTLGHPILASLDDGAARAEIGGDRENLAAILGAAPTLFAYPNGKPGTDYLARHAHMVQAAGYRAAVTTAWGAAGHGQDLFQIPRFTPWDRAPARFALRLAHNYSRGDFALA